MATAPNTGGMILSVLPLQTAGVAMCALVVRAFILPLVKRRHLPPRRHRRFRGTYFGLHDTLAAFNPYRKDRSAVGLISKMAVAQTAALSAATVAFPISTLVDRWNVLNFDAKVPLREAARLAMDGRGVAGLFRGYPSQISTSVGSGLMLMLYGEVKGRLFAR